VPRTGVHDARVGVEYQHFLVPTEPSLRPSAERIVAFVEALEEQRWIARPSDPSRRPRYKAVLDGPAPKKKRLDLLGSWALPRPLEPGWLRERKAAIEMTWPQTAESRYPLTRFPYLRESMYWSIEIHWTRWFLPVSADNLYDGAKLACACGESVLREKWDLTLPFKKWLLTKCPACGAAIDPMAAGRSYVSPWTGKSRFVAGTALHRFKLVVDCGKSVPEDDGGPPVTIAPELTQLATDHLGGTFHDDIGLFC
jgi:hypothetical protein